MKALKNHTIVTVIVLCVILPFLGGCTSGEVQTDAQSVGLKGKVKKMYNVGFTIPVPLTNGSTEAIMSNLRLTGNESIRLLCFNEQGFLTEQRDFYITPNGRQSMRCTEDYKVINQMEISNDEELKYIIKYDEYGFIMDDDPMKVTTDSEGRVIKAENKEMKIESEWRNGLLAVEWTYTLQGFILMWMAPSQKEDFYYNDKRQLIRKVTHNGGFGGDSTLITYTYDNQGRLVEEKRIPYRNPQDVEYYSKIIYASTGTAPMREETRIGSSNFIKNYYYYVAEGDTLFFLSTDKHDAIGLLKTKYKESDNIHYNTYYYKDNQIALIYKRNAKGRIDSLYNDNGESMGSVSYKNGEQTLEILNSRVDSSYYDYVVKNNNQNRPLHTEYKQADGTAAVTRDYTYSSSSLEDYVCTVKYHNLLKNDLQETTSTYEGGLLMEEVTKTSDSSLKATYTYDKYGNATKVVWEETSNGGSRETTVYYQYLYDDYGNWTRRITSHDNGIYDAVDFRFIDYY